MKISHKTQVVESDYVYIINWFWDNVPYMSGYKPSYGILFLALLDSIKRNEYRGTSVNYDRLINVTKISKMVFLEARLWLFERNLISCELGVNVYKPAVYKLGNTLFDLISNRDKAA